MKIFSLLSSLLLVGVSVSLPAATTINPTNHFAHAANLGWVDWRGNSNSGAVIGRYVCSGYLYAANVGWINLGDGAPANGIRYGNQAAADFGVNHDGLGNLHGYAWGANIGWLTFTNRTAAGALYDGPKVDLFTGQLSGFVWSANAGWIGLSNLLAFVQTDTLLPGADTDGDGLPDPWELENFGTLSTANATSDSDRDGASDLQEWIAGTDPKAADSRLSLGVTPARPGDPRVYLTWPSQPTRQYRILKAYNLTPPPPWSDVGLGWFNADPGSSTSRSFLDDGPASRFYRIEVTVPLAP